MTCPLCSQRKARRACPALGHEICAVCCGTKRLVEIQCPSGCVYLAAARDHPPAVALRRHERDVGLFVRFVRDLSQRQSQLFFAVSTFLSRYEAPALQPLIDEDVAEATAALAATFETSSRGVIYDHRPPSRAAERLATALKPLVEEAGRGGGTTFEREAAVVLRRLESATREVRAVDAENRRAFLDLVGRVLTSHGDQPEEAEAAADTPRIIIP